MGNVSTMGIIYGKCTHIFTQIYDIYHDLLRDFFLPNGKSSTRSTRTKLRRGPHWEATPVGMTDHVALDSVETGYHI
jgi:hypothetical protein